MTRPSTFALIVAAGAGTRAGSGPMPKQFQALSGKALLDWSVAAFADHPVIDGVLCVLPAQALRSAAAQAPKRLEPVAGGATRQQSVRNGLEALADLSPDRVLIHDAARPLVSAEVITRIIVALDHAAGAIPVTPVQDTLKRGALGEPIQGTVERQGLWRAQTPQGFDFKSILSAHRALAGGSYTDDAAIAEAMHIPVTLVEGDMKNIKITTAEDFAIAEALMGKNEGAAAAITVTGQGFDVHRLVPGDGVWLCGVKIAGELKLLGHSDADAGLHALTDAILGAVAADDIGVHFPPSDERWRNAPSGQFLLHALSLMRAAGGTLQHVDVTIICERPRVSPHRAAMRARLSDLTGLPLARVSIKATTTEGLGFAGRGEGLAAQAVATVTIRP